MAIPSTVTNGSMADRDGVIWYDGKLVDWRSATTHVLTHTLHYGMGVFEGVRAYKTDKGAANSAATSARDSTSGSRCGLRPMGICARR